MRSMTESMTIFLGRGWQRSTVRGLIWIKIGRFHFIQYVVTWICTSIIGTWIWTVQVNLWWTHQIIFIHQRRRRCEIPIELQVFECIWQINRRLKNKNIKLYNKKYMKLMKKHKIGTNIKKNKKYIYKWTNTFKKNIKKSKLDLQFSLNEKSREYLI